MFTPSSNTDSFKKPKQAKRMQVQTDVRFLMTKWYLTWSLLPLPASKQDAESTQHLQHPQELTGRHSSLMKSSHPLPRHRQPPMFSCCVSVRWVRKEGAVCIATSYTQAAQLLYPQKEAGKSKQSLLPCGWHLQRQPKGRPLALPVLYGYLGSREEGILSIQREERQVVVRAQTTW